MNPFQASLVTGRFCSLTLLRLKASPLSQLSTPQRYHSDPESHPQFKLHEQCMNSPLPAFCDMLFLYKWDVLCMRSPPPHSELCSITFEKYWVEMTDAQVPHMSKGQGLYAPYGQGCEDHLSIVSKAGIFRWCHFGYCQQQTRVWDGNINLPIFLYLLITICKEQMTGKNPVERTWEASVPTQQRLFSLL